MYPDKIGVLIVDDHPLAVAGVRLMLETARDITVVSTAASAEEALTELDAHAIDVAIVDIGLPGQNGIALLERMRHVAPTVAVLILSAYGEEIYAFRALRGGARGYLGKGAQLDCLLDAVRTVVAGGTRFSAGLNDMLVKQIQRGSLRKDTALSAREFEVLMLIVGGASTNAIAELLGRSAKTISTHRRRLLDKLGLSSNAELTRYAINEGLVDLPALAEDR